jgi:hypothetical protein
MSRRSCARASERVHAVLESDLRELFHRQAAVKLSRAPISIPAARRIGRARLLRRRAGAIGSPILAAGAVIAVVLAGTFAAGPAKPSITPGIPAAPKLFNPLVPYASLTWYPYQPSLVGSDDWHTALLLRASSRSPAQSTEVVLYAAGWCTRKSASLSCGSTAAGTKVDGTVTGRAPDVQGQPAYWTRYSGGNLLPLRPRSGDAEMVAFQYARGGWAVAETTGTRADVIRVASSLQYGKTSPLRFPFRLTGLPQEWSEVLFAGFTHGLPSSAQSPAESVLVLGSPATRPGTTAIDALTVVGSNVTTVGPHCRTAAVRVGRVGQHLRDLRHSHSRPTTCPSLVINGYRVYLNTPPVAGKQTLFTPSAGGLYLYEQTDSPHAPLSPTAIFAHHLQLLGPNAADWTTTPSAGETIHLDHQ